MIHFMNHSYLSTVGHTLTEYQHQSPKALVWCDKWTITLTNVVKYIQKVQIWCTNITQHIQDLISFSGPEDQTPHKSKAYSLGTKMEHK